MEKNPEGGIEKYSNEHPAKITCSKSTIETLEKGVRYVEN